MFSLYCSYRSYDSQTQQYVNHNNCFYDDSIPDESYRVFSPELEKEVGTSGSLSFVLPPSNVGYNDVSRDSCELVCYKNDKEIWRGRILSDKSDFYNQRSITCEGVLSYLNDVIIPKGNYGTADNPLRYSVLIATILSIYNAKNGGNNIENPNYAGPYDKRIFLSSFPDGTHSGKYIEIDNNNVLDIINTICEDTNLYPVVKRDNIGTSENPAWRNKLYFVEGTKQASGEYFPDATIEDQEIIFGENLLDFTRNYDVTTLVTAVTMKGSNIEDSENDDYYTLTELDKNTSTNPISYSDRTDSSTGIMHPAKQTYMYYPAAVASYGWRETLLEVETTGTEESTPVSAKPSEQLWTIGLNYLRVSQFDSMVIDIKAVDLTYLGVSSESLDIYYNIKVISEPHGLNRYFPITAIKIPLDNPADTEYTMGIEDDISLSGSYNKLNQDLLDKINALPKTSSLLEMAKKNAASAIAGATTGHITIVQNEEGHSDALVISTMKDYKNTSPTNQVWVFNSGGLAHWTGGWNGTSDPQDTQVAITKDGHIVANMITVGTMNANMIKGGQITIQDVNTATGPYVDLTKDAFVGHRADGTTTFYITPFIAINGGSLPSGFSNNYAISYKGVVNVFESEDTWVGDTQGNKSLVSKQNMCQTLGSYAYRAGRADSMCVDSKNYNYNATLYGDSNKHIALWRIRIGGRYLSFSHGLLVQDEPVETDPITNYTNYYSGNITIDGTTWKVNNGLIVGRVSDD